MILLILFIAKAGGPRHAFFRVELYLHLSRSGVFFLDTSEQG